MCEGYCLMKKVIVKGNLLEVFFIVSDFMVIGMLKVFQEVGLQVLWDIVIVSFNGIEEVEFVSMFLMMVKVYIEEMGCIGVKLLFDCFNG